MPPEPNATRRRIKLKMSESFNTLHVQKVEEESVDASENSSDASRKWRQTRVVWSVPISFVLLSHIAGWIFGGHFG